MSASTEEPQPISEGVADYRDALETYRAHPALPTCLNLLEAGAHARVRLQSLEAEVLKLAEIDDDQFYCEKGGAYVRANWHQLQSVSEYLPHSRDSVSISRLLWKVLSNFQSGEIWSFSNYLVGVKDYSCLHEIAEDDEREVDAQKARTATRIVSNVGTSDLTPMAAEAATAMDAVDEVAHTFSSRAAQLGVPMVPWAAWISDLMPDGSEISDCLKDFSLYLEKYFAQANASDGQTGSYGQYLPKMDTENAGALARISAYLLFSRLFHELAPDENFSDLASFTEARLRLMDGGLCFDHPEEVAEYIVSVSNLMMMTAKLDLDSVREGLVSAAELNREFLADVTEGQLDLASVAALPGSGFAQVVASINPYECDLAGRWKLGAALRLADYGLPGPWDEHLFQQMFDAAFDGLDPDVASSLRPKIESVAMDWLLPLHDLGRMSEIHSRLWDDDLIVEKISRALFNADQMSAPNVIFPAGLLAESATSPGEFSDKLHPALFALKFSNPKAFFGFANSEWTDFARSLAGVGQVRFACAVAALHLHVFAVNNALMTGLQTRLDLPSLIQLFRELSGLQSFGMVRVAVAELLGVFDPVPPEYLGSLKEFGRPAGGTVLTLHQKFEQQCRIERDSLIDAGLWVDRLNGVASEFLLCARLNSKRARADLASAQGALANYFNAVEAELASRCSNIDATVADVLNLHDIKTKPRSAGGLKGSGTYALSGIGGYLHLLKGYPWLPPQTQSYLSCLAPLAQQNYFLVSLEKLLHYRNKCSHAELPLQEVARVLSEVERLIFETGFLKILCDTAV
jgi:hypothetical protein